ncbi:MAG: hypothetical protein OEZ36_10510 [Spirochaetota bacterium]|nr:hypothetical protein [Spirochaetota bacterium]
MKKISYSIIFIFGLIGINAILSYLYIDIIMSKSRLMVSDKRFKNYDKQIDMLLLGDSHINTGINPKHLAIPSFNWAHQGTSYLQNYYKLKYYIEKKLKNKPKKVLIQFDLQSFRRAGIDRNDFYWVKYVDYFQVSKDRPFGSRYKIWIKYLKGRFIPYAGEKDTLFQWKTLRKRNYRINKWGFKSRGGQDFSKLPNRKRLKMAKKRVGKSLVKEKKQLIKPIAVKYFSLFLSLCEKHNIHVILLKSPLSKEYLQEAMKYVSIKDFYTSLDAIIKKHKHVTVLDYQTAYINRNELFADQDHLNEKGSRILTKKINEEIKKLFKLP